VVVGIPTSAFTVEVKSADAHCSRRRFLAGDSQLLPLVKKTRMTPENYERNIMHLTFDLDKTDIRYNIGDSLAIYPKTTDALVQRFCAYVNMDAETIVSTTAVSEMLADKFPKVSTVGKIAAEVLDLAGRPTRKLYKMLSYFADGAEKEELAKLANGEGDFLATVAAETMSVMDVLEHFTCRADFAHLLEVVPTIKPRLYSIASSQKLNPHTLELCIVVNTWKTASGVAKTGVCTGYLDSLDLSNGPVQVAVSVNSGALFMPKDTKASIMMAGLGTGIAPFRAFVQEKAVQKRAGSEIAFLLGLRYRADEYLFGDEFEALEKEGVISHLLPAFSRDQARKIYIQSKVDDNQKMTCDILIEKKGYFFYCGPAGSVPSAIEASVVNAFKCVYNVDEEKAKGMLNEVKSEGRYVVEAWS
jgi:sulfite reductase alpha subunit-like flavoprotein